MAGQMKLNVLSKFDEACGKISNSNKKFLMDNGKKFSDEEDDCGDISNNDAVVDKILTNYADGDANSVELRRVKQALSDAIQSGGTVCLICISVAKKHEAVWSCKGCFGTFHLQCLQKWARDSMLLKELNNVHPAEVKKWYCPKCRFEYLKEECPTKYFCYCGKVEDPEFDPWLVPHSCGQVCGRDLTPLCGHKCSILCHPGPCPPCPQVILLGCHCGREKPQMRRCSNRHWACNRVCKKLLSCKQHTCQQQCHSGNCPPCDKQSSQPCICGRYKESRACADAVWQCDKECGRALSCGFHECQIVCHSGSCGHCPKSKQRSCPCGKTSRTLPCNEEIPPCGDTCGKLLSCSIHYCAQRCHVGDCGMCLQMRTRKCRCGLKEKSMPCYKEFLCETKCKNIRDCGRHACNRKCCDGNCPSCEQQCGRSLGCGNHKCSSRCHRGPCYPCHLMVANKCFCGETSVDFPCGRRNYLPPRCRQQCKIPPKCHHPKVQDHHCHFEDCPRCRLVCSKELSCGHICPAKCHSAVPTKIEVHQKRAGPWEPAIAPKIEIVCQPCPPCEIPINVVCLGQHERQDRPCSIANKPFSCHRQCGRKLACGNHTCSLLCHLVSNAPSSHSAGDNCLPCELPCTLKRPFGCQHSCVKLCHLKPCPPCRLMVQQRCHCQISLLHIDCYKWTAASKSDKAELLSCGDRCPKLMECGHRCFSRCHLGTCTSSDSCKKKVVVRCKCKRIKQELVCNLIMKGEVNVNCNAECLEIMEKEMKRKNEAAVKMEKEQQEKNTRELEKFQRKMDGKKRKQKKHKEIEEQKSSFWKDYKWMIVASLIIAIVAGIFILYIR